MRFGTRYATVAAVKILTRMNKGIALRHVDRVQTIQNRQAQHGTIGEPCVNLQPFVTGKRTIVLLQGTNALDNGLFFLVVVVGQPLQLTGNGENLNGGRGVQQMNVVAIVAAPPTRVCRRVVLVTGHHPLDDALRVHLILRAQQGHGGETPINARHPEVFRDLVLIAVGFFTQFTDVLFVQVGVEWPG